MQVRKEIRLASFDFSNEEIFVSSITNVSPHGEVFHKHFKEVIVVNGILELLQLLGSELCLAQETPVDTVHKGNFIRRGLASIAYNRFSETLFMTQSTLALLALAGQIQIDLFRFRCLLFFFFRSMLMTKRQRIITIRLGRIIKRAVIVE